MTPSGIKSFQLEISVKENLSNPLLFVHLFHVIDVIQFAQSLSHNQAMHLFSDFKKSNISEMAEVFFLQKNFAKLLSTMQLQANQSQITFLTRGNWFLRSKERSVAGQLKTNLFEENSRYSKKTFQS